MSAAPFVMTDARIEANRRNAALSTGPRTAEGKAASRLNGLKHGMRAELPVLPGEDAEALEHRRSSWAAELRPDGELQAYLVDNAVAASVGIDRCRRQEAADLAKQYEEAADRWDDDRAAEVQRLADSLPDDPCAAGRLKRSAGGCRWLINRWDRLLAQLNHASAWDTVERNLAIRMLGMRPEDLFADPRVDAIFRANLAAYYGKRKSEEEYAGALARETSTGRTEWGIAEQASLMISGLPEKEQGLATLKELTKRELEDLRERAEALEEKLEVEHESARGRSLLDDGPCGALRLRYMSAHQKVLRDSLRDLAARRKGARGSEDEEEHAATAGGWEVEEPTAVAEPAPDEPKVTEAKPAPSEPKEIEAPPPSEPKPAPVAAAPAPVARLPFPAPMIITNPNDGPHSLPTWPYRP